ncbi:MAG: hypothetical protein ACXABG_05315 [Promethearchaeota archaeon]|jgi:hypothetical protein
MKKEKSRKELEAEEVEKIFEALWKNWESRRKCEQAHTPEFLMKKKSESRD